MSRSFKQSKCQSFLILMLGAFSFLSLEAPLQNAKAADNPSPEKAVTVNVKTFGAVGDQKTDDTKAIQAALDSMQKGGVLYFPPGDYRTTDTIRIPHNYITILADNHRTTRITYLGKKFVNILEVNREDVRGVKIKNLGLFGGEYLKGTSKYCFYAKHFHTDCEISGCLMRESVGMIRIDAGWYARIHNNVMESVTHSAAAAGITHEQWIEVHGPDSAPVYMKSMNSCDLDNNVYSALGGSSNNIQTRYALRISGGASSMNNNCIECCGVHPGSNPPRFDASVQTLIRFDHWAGTVNNLYLELINATGSLFEIDGDTSHASQVSMQNCSFYNVICDTMFRSASSNSVVLSNTYFYRFMANKLVEIAPTYPGRAVIFNNCSIMPGQRITDKSINAHENNLYDTKGTPWPMGISDGDVEFPETRRMFPKILNGLTVTPGADDAGAYIQLTCGLFLNESGTRVSLVRRAGGSPIEENDEKVRNVHVLVRVRPDEKNKYYRLFLGIAGQPYLKKYHIPPKDPTGNWIAQFRTNDKNAVEDMTSNPRLKIEGEYFPGRTICRAVSVGIPKDGYWLKGDRIVNPDPSAGGVAEWICIKPGRAGVDAQFAPIGVLSSSGK
jgi:hypothetical protein